MTFDEAVAALERGGVAVVPTDTVYGLAASPSAPGGVAQLFRLKGRDRAKAIPVLAPGASELEAVAVFDARARRLGARFWPGALTLVLARAPGFDADLGGAAPTVAVRVPDHPVVLELLRRTGPLAVTSANLSGEPPLTTADSARAVFGQDVVVLEGGTCDGAASTVLDLTGEPRVLREGALDANAVLQASMS